MNKIKNLIIEGLSGSGKSKIIKKLELFLNKNNIDYKIYFETETFGDFMDELSDKNKSDSEKIYRLNDILNKIEKDSKETLIILERFHLSYYALIDNWDLYFKIDELLSEKNFLLVLLEYNQDLIIERALNHFDIKENGLELAVEYFGSLEKAIEAYTQSKINREIALKKTKIPNIKIDTSSMDWNFYLEEIILFY
ncbi:MAG: hypothetical protein AABZ74_16360 [Cyanobacteriota bacterium]